MTPPKNPELLFPAKPSPFPKFGLGHEHQLQLGLGALGLPIYPQPDLHHSPTHGKLDKLADPS